MVVLLSIISLQLQLWSSATNEENAKPEAPWIFKVYREKTEHELVEKSAEERSKKLRAGNESANEG